MKFIKTIRHIFTQAVILTVCLSVAVITVAGAIIPDNPSVQVGFYNLTKTPTGFSIYQPGGANRYYLLSALSDYLNDTNGQKIMLRPSAQSASLNNSIMQKSQNIFNTITYYFHLNPFITKVMGNNLETDYSANIKSNTININQKVTGLTFRPSSLISIISYQDDDIVFDSNGTVFTESLPENLSIVTKLSGKDLTLDDPSFRYDQIDSNIVYLINPSIPGVLKITTAKNQLISIDKNNKHIEIQTFANESTSDITAEYQIESLPNYLGIKI